MEREIFHQDIESYLKDVIATLNHLFLVEKKKFSARWVKEGNVYTIQISERKLDQSPEVMELPGTFVNPKEWHARRIDYSDDFIWLYQKEGEPIDWLPTSFFVSPERPRSYQDANDLAVARLIHLAARKGNVVAYDLFFNHPDIIRHVTSYYGEFSYHLSNGVSFEIGTNASDDAESFKYFFDKLRKLGAEPCIRPMFDKQYGYELEWLTPELKELYRNPNGGRLPHLTGVEPMKVTGRTMVEAALYAYLDAEKCFGREAVTA